MKNYPKMFIAIGLVILLLSGCGGGMTGQQQEISPLQLGDRAIEDQRKADNAKKIVLSMDEVLEVKGVNLDNKIYLAPRVTHFSRLWLEDIRKTAFDHVKKRYPDATVHVSTDKKIYMELEKLEKQLKERTISKKTLDKRLKKLEEDMKG